MADNNKNEESVFRGNEVMMMLEQMSDGIAIIAEEQKDLKKNVAIIAEEQKDLKKNVAIIAEEQKDLKKSITAITEEQNNLRKGQEELRTEMNEKFDQVFEFLSNIEDELVAVRKEVERLKKDSATKEDLAKLDSRITVLERRFEMANIN